MEGRRDACVRARVRSLHPMIDDSHMDTHHNQHTYTHTPLDHVPCQACTHAHIRTHDGRTAYTHTNGAHHIDAITRVLAHTHVHAHHTRPVCRMLSRTRSSIRAVCVCVHVLVWCWDCCCMRGADDGHWSLVSVTASSSRGSTAAGRSAAIRDMHMHTHMHTNTEMG